jgi:hypothetical protein
MWLIIIIIKVLKMSFTDEELRMIKNEQYKNDTCLVLTKKLENLIERPNKYYKYRIIPIKDIGISIIDDKTSNIDEFNTECTILHTFLKEMNGITTKFKIASDKKFIIINYKIVHLCDFNGSQIGSSTMASWQMHCSLQI